MAAASSRNAAAARGAVVASASSRTRAASSVGPVTKRRRSARDAEPDAVLVGLGPHPEHVGEVQPDVAVLGRDLVPALAAESVLEVAELLVAHPQSEGRARLEADADALGHVTFSVLPPAGRSRSARRPRTSGAGRQRASRGCPGAGCRR